MKMVESPGGAASAPVGVSVEAGDGVVGEAEEIADGVGSTEGVELLRLVGSLVGVGDGVVIGGCVVAAVVVAVEVFVVVSLLGI